MMTKLREFSKFFIIIIALSFIGLMIFQWGMNYSGKSNQPQFVGKVNGHELKYKMFSDLYQQAYQEQRARSGKTQFNDSELQQLRDMVWERFIQQTLFKEEMEKLDISVSDSEIVYQIYNYPLEDFKKHPSFQTNGIFDMNKYHAAFGNPNIPWHQVEQIYREQIPFIKLQNIITSTARISEKEIMDEFIRNNLKARVDYISVPARKFENASILVSDAEIEAYYTAHKEDYKQDEKRKLKYVEFDIRTTAADTSHLMSEFKGIRDRLAAGEDFNALALEYSEDPSVKTNKGVIDYFKRGDMVKPFSDAAFAAKKGDIVGPVETSYGFHLIKVEDRKNEKGEQKVKVSHILLTVTPAPSRVSEIESNARYFSEDAKDGNFEDIAKKNEYTVKETNFFTEKGNFIPGIGNNPAIMNFAFSNKIGSVSGLYNLDKKGYVVLMVSAVQPEGYKSIEMERRSIENRVRFEKAKDTAREFAVKIGEKVKTGVDLKTITEQDTSHTLRFATTPLFTLTGSVPGVGKSVNFTAAAFALELNQTSDMIETDRGFYYLKLLEKTAFDSTAFNQQKETIKRTLLNQKRSLIFEKWYADLKEKADIVDNRKIFGL